MEKARDFEAFRIMGIGLRASWLSSRYSGDGVCLQGDVTAAGSSPSEDQGWRAELAADGIGFP